MTFTGFSQIFTSLVELFGVIYTTGTMLFAWMITPLSETFGDADPILGDIVMYTPFELMFGVGLFVLLALALVKFMTPL